MANTTPRQRVEQELAELEERIEKLRTFLPLSKAEHQPVLLHTQLAYMDSYARVLRERLSLWEN